jgi:hypothetical protein
MSTGANVQTRRCSQKWGMSAWTSLEVLLEITTDCNHCEGKCHVIFPPELSLLRSVRKLRYVPHNSPMFWYAFHIPFIGIEMLKSHYAAPWLFVVETPTILPISIPSCLPGDSKHLLHSVYFLFLSSPLTTALRCLCYRINPCFQLLRERIKPIEASIK